MASTLRTEAAVNAALAAEKAASMNTNTCKTTATSTLLLSLLSLVLSIPPLIFATTPLSLTSLTLAVLANLAAWARFLFSCEEEARCPAEPAEATSPSPPPPSVSVRQRHVSGHGHGHGHGGGGGGGDGGGERGVISAAAESAAEAGDAGDGFVEAEILSEAEILPDEHALLRELKALFPPPSPGDPSPLSDLLEKGRARDQTLVKFLRARDNSVVKARAMLVAHLAWYVWQSALLLLLLLLLLVLLCVPCC